VALQVRFDTLLYHLRWQGRSNGQSGSLEPACNATHNLIATLYAHMLRAQGFMGMEKVAFHRRLRP